MNIYSMFKFFLQLLLLKKYPASYSNNGYRLSSGHFIFMQDKTITIINEHFDRESTKTRQLVEFNYEKDAYIVPDVSAFLRHMLEVELGESIVDSLITEVEFDEEEVLPVKKETNEPKKSGRFGKKKNA